LSFSIAPSYFVRFSIYPLPILHLSFSLDPSS
jgi:hypothetical protein